MSFVMATKYTEEINNNINNIIIIYTLILSHTLSPRASFSLCHPFLLVYNLGCLKTQQTQHRGKKGQSELQVLQQTDHIMKRSTRK